ncbi:hypothetical protein JB92DRAFT_2826418 [Gautieria morchelliformis]|nr:hypothetical protein JB92DRAFT_2826418 [Gautieria morchelliformis]
MHRHPGAPAQLQPRMQPAHRARCAVRSSRQWPCFFACQADSSNSKTSLISSIVKWKMLKKFLSWLPDIPMSGLDMDTRLGPQGDWALPVHIQPTDTTPLMVTPPRHTVGTKSSIGERRGLTLWFSLRSVQKDQSCVLSGYDYGRLSYSKWLFTV